MFYLVDDFERRTLPTNVLQRRRGRAPWLQGLNRQAPDRPGNPDSADYLPAEIMHGHGRASHFIIELAVVNRNSGPANFLKFAPQASLW